MPAHRLDVHIDGAGDDPRTVRLVPSDARHSVLLDALP
jgi:hypothetical protein